MDRQRPMASSSARVHTKASKVLRLTLSETSRQEHLPDFLRLPSILRVVIYALTLSDDIPKWSRRHTTMCRHRSRTADTETPPFACKCPCAKRKGGLGLVGTCRAMYDDLSGIFYSQTRFCFDDLEQFVEVAKGLRLPQRQAVKEVSIMRWSHPSDYYSHDRQSREAALCKCLFVDGLLFSLTSLQFLELDASYLQHKSHEKYIHSRVWKGTDPTAPTLPRFKGLVCERVYCSLSEGDLYIARTFPPSDRSRIAFDGAEAHRAVQLLIEEWGKSGRWRKGFDEDVFDIAKRYCEGSEPMRIWGLPRRSAERGRMAREERTARSLNGLHQPLLSLDVRGTWLGDCEKRSFEDHMSAKTHVCGSFVQRNERKKKEKLRQMNGAEKYVVKIIAMREALRRDAKDKKQDR